jgi:hypothetical protein
MTLIVPVSSIFSVIIHYLALHLRFSKLRESRAGPKFSSDYIRLIFSHCCLQNFFFRWVKAIVGEELEENNNEMEGNADPTLFITL